MWLRISCLVSVLTLPLAACHAGSEDDAASTSGADLVSSVFDDGWCGGSTMSEALATRILGDNFEKTVGTLQFQIRERTCLRGGACDDWRASAQPLEIVTSSSSPRRGVVPSTADFLIGHRSHGSVELIPRTARSVHMPADQDYWVRLVCDSIFGRVTQTCMFHVRTEGGGDNFTRLVLGRNTLSTSLNETPNTFSAKLREHCFALRVDVNDVVPGSTDGRFVQRQLAATSTF
jgi:hypothetical protein